VGAILALTLLWVVFFWRVITPAVADRVVFIGAENSVGFHNPTEAQRNLGDAVAFAEKAEGLLRQALAKAGVDTPIKVDLELDKYVNGRGQKKLAFQKKMEFKDPYGTQDRM